MNPEVLGDCSGEQEDTKALEETKGTWLRQPVPVSLVKVIDHLANKITFNGMGGYVHKNQEETKGTWLSQPVPISLVEVIDRLTNKITVVISMAGGRALEELRGT